MAKEPELVARNRRLADAGDPVAQFNLGNMYRMGYQVKADHGLAVKWLSLAAGQGNAEALELLRDMGVDLPAATEGTPADLPPPVANPGSRTHTDLLRRLIERETLRLDQLLLRPEVVSAAHWQVIGTVDDAVEQIVDWAAAGAMDGFIAAPGGSVGSLRLFLEQVVPRLVEKGLFRERYSATTFAGHLAEE